MTSGFFLYSISFHTTQLPGEIPYSLQNEFSRRALFQILFRELFLNVTLQFKILRIKIFFRQVRGLW